MYNVLHVVLISSPLSSPNTNSAAGEHLVWSQTVATSSKQQEFKKFHEFIHVMLLEAWILPNAIT